MALTVEHLRPADPAEAVEFDHFMRMLPMLREQHPGDYVAVCGGEVIARDSWLDAVDREAKRLAPGRVVYLGFIDPPDYVVHFTGITVLEELSE
jgi:hypothetical protein